MQVTLINPYELGRQPFGLAQPVAWLRRAGFDVVCIDLSLEPLSEEGLRDAGMVAIHLPMHTATRIALEALPKVRALAPRASLCAYGLYAAPNASLLAGKGFDTILGGECEPDLVAAAERVRSSGSARPAQKNDDVAGLAGAKAPSDGPVPVVNLAKIEFLIPERDLLPDLARYASLILPDDSERRVGFVEGSRGCKHRCRHCPVVPTYDGRFRVVPVDVVMQDIRNQVAAGAEHISFGDPDFLNGPTHARRILDAFGAEFPDLGFDCTIKIEHLLDHAEMLPVLAGAGCRFVTTAVEAVDNEILQYLDKGHTVADFEHAVALGRQAGLALAPTFVPFTPWTSVQGYCDLLDKLAELELVYSVPPVQLSIRLLVPGGSRLLELEDFAARVGPFDPALLGHAWVHDDPRVDELQRTVQTLATTAEEENWSRRHAFDRIRVAAYDAAGHAAPDLPINLGQAISRHSEPWYCCAEPTSAQLNAI